MTTYSPPEIVRSYRLRNMTDLVMEAQSLHTLTDDTDESSRCIYHFDYQCQGLKKWAWPCYLGRDGISTPVPPDELEEHSRDYVFQTPCCPCAYLRGVAYTPTKITLLESINDIRNDPLKRPFVGEYVAECTTGACEYFVVLERFYGSDAVPHRLSEKRVRRFNPDLFAFIKSRGQDITPVTEVSGFRRVLLPPQSKGFDRGPNKLKRSRGEGDEGAGAPLDGVDDEQMDNLMKAGLAENEFWELFIQCATCGHVLPRAAYPYAHRCAKKVKVAEGDLCLRDTDFLEVMAAEADEEDRAEQEEIEELDRQLDILRAAMHPGSRTRQRLHVSRSSE
ncbi:hypothetical protein FA13DRAFT_1790799 [Coprinellus micaceus]|uniref:Uncharacterized protein n=1 Tax=Coprinellus micaceus TaxID=71717 RepID=A0A4Y7TEX2_COPMI|nr:hypothetical protein FA13DRAFT_1790799 [Coprinellus micaceus]